jgi:hypothetical protein
VVPVWPVDALPVPPPLVGLSSMVDDEEIHDMAKTLQRAMRRGTLMNARMGTSMSCRTTQRAEDAKKGACGPPMVPEMAVRFRT